MRQNASDEIESLSEQILAASRAGHRRLIALAGAPASGKSTIAAQLAKLLSDSGCCTQIVPMDGFHLHNQILMERGLLDRKGAPNTFDVNGFVSLVSRLHNEREVVYPTFDRARDIAIAGAGVIEEACDTIIIEGNYLLFDAPLWRDLHGHWDLTIRLEVPVSLLTERLVGRWLSYGLTCDQAEKRAAENDLANAALIVAHPLPSDILFTLGTMQPAQAI